MPSVVVIVVVIVVVVVLVAIVIIIVIAVVVVVFVVVVVLVVRSPLVLGVCNVLASVGIACVLGFMLLSLLYLCCLSTSRKSCA